MGRGKTKGFYKDEVFMGGSIGAVTYEAKKKGRFVIYIPEKDFFIICDVIV